MYQGADISDSLNDWPTSKISRCMFYIFTPLESNMKQILLWSSYWWKIKQLRSVPDRLQIKRNISPKQAFDSLFAIMVDIEHEKAIIGITSFLKYTICTTQVSRKKGGCSQAGTICGTFVNHKSGLKIFVLFVFYVSRQIVTKMS